MKFNLLQEDHKIIKDENMQLKDDEKELNRQVSLAEKSRDLYREELLELK